MPIRLFLIVLLSLALIFHNCFSQNFLKGKLVEQNTLAVVPYANLSLGGSGTASLDDGSFLLKVDDADRNSNLIISCIGYYSQKLSVDSLLGLEHNALVILMDQNVLPLEEVNVQTQKSTARDIVKEAIDAIPQNYSQQPFNMEFYSRVSENDGVTSWFLMEAIVKSYRKGYFEGALNRSSIIHQRTSGKPTLTRFDKKKKIDYFLYESVPMFDVFVVDMIGVGSRLKYTIFNENYFKKVDFKLTGISTFEGGHVFMIEYGKGEAIDGDLEVFNGRLFIATDDLGILKHERRIGKNYHEVIYKKNHGKYFPYFIKSIYPERKEGNTYRMSITHESLITKVVTEKVEDVPNGLLMDWHLTDTPYVQSFWDANYPLKN
jgi:hypothetical protein